MAAALACGPDAVVSHRSAAALWDLLPPTSGPVHVSVPRISGTAARSGIRLHRSRTLNATVTTRRRGIPVTKPAKTIADLRGVVLEKEHRRAVRQAAVLGYPLGPDLASDQTRSDLELDFLALCHRFGIQRPEVNARIGGIEADFLWRDSSLVVETDGYRYHRGEAAFHNDRDRSLRLRLQGYEVLRLSEAQVAHEPEAVAAALKARLRRPG